jgi:hypothetical protein
MIGAGHHLAFFLLLPLREDDKSGVSMYEERETGKQRDALQIGDWKDNEWPPEWIVQYYGPATWAEDGSWGCRTPIYMLSRTIGLQAVVEIITNEKPSTCFSQATN